MEKLKKYKRSRYEIANIKPSQIKTETINGEARICIEDTYTKAGIKYYVITTDSSGFSRFILSEDEYGEYIGLGNDAVDYTAWKATCEREILLIKCPSGTVSAYPDIYYDALEMCQKINDVKASYSCLAENITYAYGSFFKKRELEISREIIDEKVFRMQFLLKSRLNINRYSFMGDKPFTEHEIKEYEKILDKLNHDIADYFRKNLILDKLNHDRADYFKKISCKL